MASIHEIKANNARGLLLDLASYITASDASYIDSVVRQCDRIDECIANLVRYAEAIDEKKVKL